MTKEQILELKEELSKTHWNDLENEIGLNTTIEKIETILRLNELKYIVPKDLVALYHYDSAVNEIYTFRQVQSMLIQEINTYIYKELDKYQDLEEIKILQKQVENFRKCLNIEEITKLYSEYEWFDLLDYNISEVYKGFGNE